MPRLTGFIDWLDSRTGIKAGRAHLLDEPLPPGVNWWFVLGSILLFLLGLQLISGIVLAMYYVATPDYAYDSVRYVTDRVPFGGFVRALHFFGASFIVIAAVAHMARVVMFGSYKQPREVTWLTGVALLLVILAFALTGYLLPWDQKAYWATTVTINIARSTPLIGEPIAAVMRGGSELGALTLLRWYAMHVLLLPAALVALTVTHLFLMRRHGISGPITPRRGAAEPFYPYHALRDTIAVAAVFAGLITLAALVRVPLDGMADPSDATYVPRPEWYFLSLFQMLKYFPGRLEPVATLVIPGVIVTFVALLPFLDRRPERHPARRPLVMLACGLLAVGTVTLTCLGLKDSPTHSEPGKFSPLAIAGAEFAADQRCAVCHRTGGAANPVSETRITKDHDWVIAHIRDPETITPGSRKPPAGGMRESQARSVISYLQRVRAGGLAPSTVDHKQGILVYGAWCAGCHIIDGEGVKTGPDLTQIGEKHDAKWLQSWIADPEAIKADADMPAFGDRLDPDELKAVADFLAARKHRPGGRSN
jgi:quinol-cytochrome oxidoreductase complex cytochrome b subunit/cytochrome c553